MIKITHHFIEGKYSKEMRFAPGDAMGKHIHRHSHESLLAVGRAHLFVNGAMSEIKGPLIVHIEAGKEHVLIAMTDVVWFCTHDTDETDPAKIDETLVGR